jgi:hypothetical protein
LIRRGKIPPTYAKLFPVSPATMSENRVTQFQMAGYSDGEDLEMDQGGAYFDYVNRTVLGLGCGLIILMLIMLLCVQALDRNSHQSP